MKTLLARLARLLRELAAAADRMSPRTVPVPVRVTGSGAASRSAP
jgi:hypothetical protein